MRPEPNRMASFVAGWVCLQPCLGASITLELIGPEPSTIGVGVSVPIEIRATFDSPLVALSFEIAASGSAQATLVSRSANPTSEMGLTYLSSLMQNPFVDDLPHDLTESPIKEVFYDADFDNQPGGPSDGIAPGAGIAVETVWIAPASEGISVVTLQAVQAVYTQPDGMGRLFEETMIHPHRQSVTLRTAAAATPADFDGDGDVDLADFLHLQSCFGNPNHPATADCRDADLDGDGDVDLADVLTFQGAFTGAR